MRSQAAVAAAVIGPDAAGRSAARAAPCDGVGRRVDLPLGAEPRVTVVTVSSSATTGPSLVVGAADAP